MSDDTIDPKGLDAARRYATWHLGHPEWADNILEAYFNPDTTNHQIDKEQTK